MAQQAASERMPGKLKFALAAVWFQGLMNVVAAVLLFSLVSDRADHGQDEDAGVLRALAYVSLLAAAVLIAAAVLALRRLKGVRIAVIAVESILMAGALFTLFSGGGGPVIAGLVLGAFVIASFASAEGKAWFTR
ncbi:hypothetical protein [Streptomyces noursei]|uniref:hypothetical protein n=2 Tax=Streptomyces TaxID=1883 RepID=UPI000AF2AC44